jgi:hypothetical protein
MYKIQEKMRLAKETAEKIMQENLLKYKVSDKIQKERFDICLGCEYFRPTSETCKVCGCFMKVKTWMANQKCPVNKWDRVELANVEF